MRTERGDPSGFDPYRTRPHSIRKDDARAAEREHVSWSARGAVGLSAAASAEADGRAFSALKLTDERRLDQSVWLVGGDEDLVAILEPEAAQVDG